MRRGVFFVAMVLVSGTCGANEMSWACSYSDKGVQVEFNQQGQPKIDTGPAGMDPFILVLDTESGTARIRANSTIEVVPVMAGPTLSFVETTPTGLSVITLFVGSPSQTSGAIPFAQARHLDLAGPFPQSYYGTCKSLE